MYAEVVPHGELQPFVECFWHSRTRASPASTRRILPDGCVDLIFDLAPGRETAFWVGTMTKPRVIEDSRPRHFLGIRFHPGGAKGLLGLPLSELRDERVCFQSVTPSVEDVFDRLVRGYPEPFHAIQRWLAPRLAESAPFPLVESIFRRVKKSAGNVRVDELAASLGLSRQYLNRVMNHWVGVDLKTFSRIIRMRACTESLRGKRPSADWSAVAIDFGFYDQSHLIHDFNDLVGLSPTQFLDS